MLVLNQKSRRNWWTSSGAIYPDFDHLNEAGRPLPRAAQDPALSMLPVVEQPRNRNSWFRRLRPRRTGGVSEGIGGSLRSVQQ